MTGVVSVDVAGQAIHIQEDLSVDSTGAKVWNTSIVLLKYLERNRRKLKYDQEGKRVLEVGAGCGLLGIGLARLGWNVTITDMSVCLPLVKANILRNSASDESDGARIQVKELCWGETDLQQFGPPFDCIVGTDVIFLERLVAPLLEVLTALSTPSTNIFLCVEQRNAVAHEMFLQQAKAIFSVKELSPGAEFKDGFVTLLQLRKQY